MSKHHLLILPIIALITLTLLGSRYLTTSPNTQLAQVAAPSPMTTASRTECVAPCGVFFDAVDTTSPDVWTSGVVQPADGDYTSFHYEWDFGDPAGGVWSTTGKSKNEGVGYTAAHVYETPGIYLVNLDVIDTTGTTYSYQQSIVVNSFSGITYYVSSSGGDDSNDGLSTLAPFQSIDKAWSKIAPNTRILFKRGDSWTINKTYSGSISGPVIISDYGTGNKPKFIATAGMGATWMFSTGGNDWRFINLALEGNWSNPALITDNGARDTLFANIDVVGTGDLGLAMSGATNSVMYQCTATDLKSAAMYVQGTEKLAVIGTWFHDMGDSHNIYAVSIGKGVFDNNKLENATMGRHNLRLTQLTHHVVVSNNIFYGNNGNNGSVIQIRPNDDTVHTDARNILITRNYVNNSSGASLHIGSGVNGLRAVDNVFVFSVPGPGDAVIMLDSYTTIGDPDPRNIFIENNTIVQNKQEAVIHIFTYNHQNIQFRNNIIYHNYPTNDLWPAGIWVPNVASLAQVISDYNLFYNHQIDQKVGRAGGDVNPVGNYNLATWQALGKDTHGYFADPQFVNIVTNNFTLQPTSPIFGQGIGAYEYNSGFTPPPTCTTFTYTDWTPTTCPESEQQTRTIASRSPSGCTGGTPASLTQACIYEPPAATTTDPIITPPTTTPQPPGGGGGGGGGPSKPKTPPTSPTDLTTLLLQLRLQLLALMQQLLQLLIQARGY